MFTALNRLTDPASITQSVPNSRFAFESRVQILTDTASKLIVRRMYVATMTKGPRSEDESGARGADESIVGWCRVQYVRAH
jgi:hypothetical protein